jgi:parallel beta-helix repeat protein
MKKLVYLIIGMVVLGLIVTGCIPVVPPAEQDNLNTFTKSNGLEVWVDDDFTASTTGWGTTHFDKIQDGVDAVVDYGTVYVANGIYNAITTNSTECPGHPDEWWFVTINKPLELVGVSRDGVILDGTALQGQSRCTGIWVSASNVTIKNLTLQNFTQTPVAKACYALYVMEKFRDYTWDNVATLENVTAENVKAADNMYAFYFMKTTNATIKECISENNLGDGIWVAWGCDYATIQDNTIINSGDHGIWVGKTWFGGTGSNNATIIGNYVDGAREGGISFVGSDKAIISGNTITNAAGDGWSKGALSLKDGPSNIEAYNNTIYNNNGLWGGYSGTGHGIGIDGTPSNIYLHHNSIYGNNGHGIYNYSLVTINATCNWWGDASGPDHPTLNPTGTGDKVSNNVEFCPWALDNAFTNFITLTLSPLAQPVESEVYLEAILNNPTLGVSIELNFNGYSDIISTDERGIARLEIGTQEVGVYNVSASVNTLAECLTAEAFLAVYDASEGFVTGGGWIYSEAGDYVPNPSAEGKATFGFVSKYKKGATVPTGKTEFQFKAGDLNFHSDSYDWLVIAGEKAMFKGIGTINGAGKYGFMLSATDSDPDLFRIKIQDKITEEVIYDNKEGGTELGGGQIIIHKGK